jgi:hypothetical protein
VGYRGKVEAQEKARLLREEGRSLKDIADTLGVAKSSVSLWVRDIDVEIRRRKPVARRPNSLHTAKLAQIAACDQLGIERIGVLSEEAFLVAGAALYAGEGGKKDGAVNFSNSDPAMIALFCTWLRRFFVVDAQRLRMRVYLHKGLDLDAAEEFWSAVTRIPREQFQKPYRAKPDPTIRLNKHEHGCAYVRYSCSRTHREIMGLIRALLSSEAIPG